MSYPTKVLSHAQRVCRLYKAAVRNLESYHTHKHKFRYEAVLLRARFDQHKDEVDIVKAKKLVEQGQKELFENLHPQPIKFPYSPGGISFEREVHLSDWMLDQWHPLEKLQYPKYFALREKRKKEFMEAWVKKYGEPSHDDHH